MGDYSKYLRLLARKFGWVEDVDKWSLYVDRDNNKDMRTFAGRF